MSENSGSGKKVLVRVSRRTQVLACPEVTGELRGESVGPLIFRWLCALNTCSCFVTTKYQISWPSIPSREMFCQ